MQDENSAGPLRRIFFRGEGVFRFLSPGFLILSAFSLFFFGVIPGFLGVLTAGFIQDWANMEEIFSWAKKLGG